MTTDHPERRHSSYASLLEVTPTISVDQEEGMKQTHPLLSLPSPPPNRLPARVSVDLMVAVWSRRVANKNTPRKNGNPDALLPRGIYRSTPPPRLWSYDYGHA
ncbi:unnamed protein product [Laminaria digitata]